MDPRQTLSRANSSNLQSSMYNPNMASQYGMAYQQPHLPPIQSHHQSYQQQQNQAYIPQNYRPELPRYQSAPNPIHTPDRFNPAAHMSAQGSLGGLPPASLLPQPPHSYQQPSNYPPATSASQGYPTRIAPAPPRSDLSALATNFSQPDTRPAVWTTADAVSGISVESPRDQGRTHVVGSQGRRGILPSAPGRASVPANNVNGSPKNAAIPTKDADGKFPCPNCNKTYLHAKHLKRHMLRHTGDRPYMCVLCRDTFSRSDILKRHFQKCSLRRGNPAGLSHLSSPAAHLKKSQAATAKSNTDSPSAASTPTTTGAVNGAFTSTTMGTNNASSNSSNFSEAPSGPYNMVSAPPNGLQRPAPDQSFPNGNQAGVGPSGNGSWSVHNAKSNPMLFQTTPASPDHFGIAPGTSEDKRNVMAGTHQPNEDWMFPTGANDAYMNPMFSAPMGHTYEHPQNDGKKDFDAHDGSSNGYYVSSTGIGADGTLSPSIWNFNTSHGDPLQMKVDRLVDFCFPPGIQASLLEQQNDSQTRSCLTVDNVKHFLHLFSNFQGHFPYLHMSTFNFTQTYDGLILSIICIGAVYSDRVSQKQVRNLMQRTKHGIERTSSIFHNSSSATHHSSITLSGVELEELQALLMLQTLFTWHGGPSDRASARKESQILFQYVRQHGMLTTLGREEVSYSQLHNISPGQLLELDRWNWYSWIEQEKRRRLVYLIFLLDSALNIWFNCPPHFDPSEINLPLPCDDAAWEASGPEECAQALGLRGAASQNVINKSGSLRPNQIHLSDAMEILSDPTLPIQPRLTNVYSKFILIHALHTQIWKILRLRSLSVSAPPSPVDPMSGMENSSPGTSSQLTNQLRAITTALVRWKRMWDEDMQIQYPVTPNLESNSRRFGFCRDGVHFYWLARAYLQSKRIGDWELPADTRFQQMLNGMRQVREWSLTDGVNRGEEPGSIFDISSDYGEERNGHEVLELDMRKLFRPIGEM